jgi:hypothetical protein
MIDGIFRFYTFCPWFFVYNFLCAFFKAGINDFEISMLFDVRTDLLARKIVGKNVHFQTFCKK